jgi:hypothetical protein
MGKRQIQIVQMNALVRSLTNLGIREGDAVAELLFLVPEDESILPCMSAAKVMRATGLLVLMDIPISHVVSRNSRGERLGVTTCIRSCHGLGKMSLHRRVKLCLYRKQRPAVACRERCHPLTAVAGP